jgi:hypothetical protein
MSKDTFFVTNKFGLLFIIVCLASVSKVTFQFIIYQKLKSNLTLSKIQDTLRNPSPGLMAIRMTLKSLQTIPQWWSPSQAPQVLRSQLAS